MQSITLLFVVNGTPPEEVMIKRNTESVMQSLFTYFNSGPQAQLDVIMGDYDVDLTSSWTAQGIEDGARIDITHTAWAPQTAKDWTTILDALSGDGPVASHALRAIATIASESKDEAISALTCCEQGLRAITATMRRVEFHDDATVQHHGALALEELANRSTEAVKRAIAEAAAPAALAAIITSEALRHDLTTQCAACKAISAVGTATWVSSNAYSAVRGLHSALMALIGSTMDPELSIAATEALATVISNCSDRMQISRLVTVGAVQAVVATADRNSGAARLTHVLVRQAMASNMNRKEFNRVFDALSAPAVVQILLKYLAHQSNDVRFDACSALLLLHKQGGASVMWSQGGGPAAVGAAMAGMALHPDDELTQCAGIAALSHLAKATETRRWVRNISRTEQNKIASDEGIKRYSCAVLQWLQLPTAAIHEAAAKFSCNEQIQAYAAKALGLLGVLTAAGTLEEQAARRTIPGPERDLYCTQDSHQYPEKLEGAHEALGCETITAHCAERDDENDKQESFVSEAPVLITCPRCEEEAKTSSMVCHSCGAHYMYYFDHLEEENARLDMQWTELTPVKQSLRHKRRPSLDSDYTSTDDEDIRSGPICDDLVLEDM